jgi:hypothetical protein
MRPVKTRAGNFAKHSGESAAAWRVRHDDLRTCATTPIAALLLRLRRSN